MNGVNWGDYKAKQGSCEIGEYLCAGGDGFLDERPALGEVVGHGCGGAELAYCLDRALADCFGYMSFSTHRYRHDEFA